MAVQRHQPAGQWRCTLGEVAGRQEAGASAIPALGLSAKQRGELEREDTRSNSGSVSIEGDTERPRSRTKRARRQVLAGEAADG